MSLLQMSVSGAILIVVVIAIRAVTINRLPKITFLVLWGIVFARLLLPFSISSALSVYSFAGQQESSVLEPIPQSGQTYFGAEDKQQTISAAMDIVPQSDAKVLPVTKNMQSSALLSTVLKSIWAVGALLTFLYFVGSYLRCRLEFQTALPVENSFATKWIEEHSIRRRFCIRQSDRISTPLTYGIVCPVILMPKETDWSQTKQIQYILMHEYVHICRYDALTKLICICALCIHWFNPFVWIMYVIFNRDVEISCDESVVRWFGEDSKSAYARMLIQLEETRSSSVPFCSSFLSKISKNAMEERICAIVKIKKKSLLAVMVAVVLVAGVTTAFATSATESKEKSASISDTVFTEQEFEMLLSLRLDGYEDMRISEYRDKVGLLTDTKEYRTLLERFFADETLYTKYETKTGTDSQETWSYLYQILGPLADETQQSKSFNGHAVINYPNASDSPDLEYTVTLTILDADRLTVGEYDIARQYSMDNIEYFFTENIKGLSDSELRDVERVKMLIDEEIHSITATWNDDRLRIAVEYVYTPLGVLPFDDMDDSSKARKAEWDASMAPYVPFGLTYQYDPNTDDYKMYFQGKEVRGIYDERAQLWISEHAGIGQGIYDENAIELYVLYDEAGKNIVGLREATEDEMKELTKIRKQVTAESIKEQTDNDQRAEYEPIREGVPATEEDYASLLALKTPDYRSKSIAEFNSELLEWSNDNYERMERIMDDVVCNDYHVALTDDEKFFVSVTIDLSWMENKEYIRSITKNEPLQDVCANILLRSKEDTQGLAWCSLYCTYSYHISDREKVSIGERDDYVGGMRKSIEAFWESSSLDQLLKMSEDDMKKTIHAIAEKYSSRMIDIKIHDDETSFERMDERNI